MHIPKRNTKSNTGKSSKIKLCYTDSMKLYYLLCISGIKIIKDVLMSQCILKRAKRI